jgi:hypothetical protein
VLQLDISKSLLVEVKQQSRNSFVLFLSSNSILQRINIVSYAAPDVAPFFNFFLLHPPAASDACLQLFLLSFSLCPTSL